MYLQTNPNKNMNNKDLLKLLNNVQEQGDDTPKQRRVLLIDALNLFFRNFAVINAVNEKGIHIGGLGGFFRSLGAMIKQIEPTEVYIVWDGVGSSNNRKNIIPEYKSERNISRITNWGGF
jgi:5'-3' exonuclease